MAEVVEKARKVGDVLGKFEIAAPRKRPIDAALFYRIKDQNKY